MNKPVRVSGSGGLMGGGGSTPTITPDTLLSKDIVEFTLGVCEGPIAGLLDGPKTFYLDDTPLVSQGDDNNFNPFELHMYHGDADASKVRNTRGGVTSNIQVGVRLAEATPVVRVTPSTLRNNIDRLEVRVVFNTLVTSNDKGDQLENTARIKIRYRNTSDLVWKNFFGNKDQVNAIYESTRVEGDDPDRQRTVTKEVDLKQTGNFATQDSVAQGGNGGSGFTIVGQVVDTSEPGYTHSKTTTHGTLYINTSNDDYKFVVDQAAAANLTKSVENKFSIRASTFLGSSYTGEAIFNVGSPNVLELKGKTTSGYAKDFAKGVPRVNADWEIEVTKLNEDNVEYHTAVITWESVQCVTQVNKAYDNLAVIRGLGQASDQFSGIPRFSGVYGCMLIKVPDNYDPITRYCAGAWGGTFKLAHSDNPAWCLYDLAMNETYGLKAHYPHLKVDRFSFYDAAKWCDELVPRPGGGYQPRFTYNDKIDQPRNALELFYQIAAIFGAVPVTDLNGTVSLKIDKPGLPSQIFGPESVTEQGFQYAFSDVTQRSNDIMVKFTNPHLSFNEDVRQVFDQSLIDKNGRVPDEMIALGCNDVYEAQRRAYRRLLQANTETTTVSFQTARMGLGLELFDLVGIVDPHMNWGASGRVKSKSGSTIYLRDALYLPTNTDMTFEIQTSSGIHELTVQASQPAATELTVISGTWPTDAPDFAQFAISSVQTGLVKPFRILRIEEDTQNSELLTIVALEQNVNKYSDADNMVSSGTVKYDSSYARHPDAPVITNVQSGTEHLYVNSDGKVSSRILVEWEHNPGSFVDEFLVHYRRKGIDTQFRRFRTSGRDAYIENVQDGQKYEIFVVAENPIGRRSFKNQRIRHTVIGKTAKPSDVTGLVANQSGPDVRLDFDAVDDVDLSHYNVKLGALEDTWETAQYIGQASSNSFVDRNIRQSPAQYFVKAVDTSKNKSVNAATLVYNVPVPGAPTVSVSFDQGSYVLNITPDPLDEVPVSTYVVRQNGNILFDGKSSRFTGQADWVGTKTFDVTVINLAGEESAATSVNGNIVAPAAPTLTTFIAETAYYLQWNVPVATLPIDYYVVKDITSGQTLEANSPGTIFSGYVEWLGNHDFEVYAVDTAGNAGAVASGYVNVVAPTVTGLVSSVSRSILKLTWTGNPESLPIRKYRVYEGVSFGSATEIGRIDAETISVEVDWNGTKTFWVVAVDTAGNTSAEVSVLETIDPPSLPVVSAEIVDQNVHLNWTDSTTELLIGGYEIRRHYEGQVEPPVLLQTIKATGVTFPAKYVGLGTFYVKPVDEAGNVGPEGSTTLQIDPPGAFTFTPGINDVKAEFEWDTPVATLPIDYYEIRRGSSFGASSFVARVSTNNYNFTADWAGTETFWITAYDTAGNASPTQTGDIDILAPSAPAPRSEVIDNNVLLRWTNGSGTLPVVSTEIRKGTDFATAEVMQQVDATFATFFEFSSGDYTYWLVEIDSAGNYGTAAAITTVVSEPPDFVLQTAYTSDFSGTKTMVIDGPNGLLFGIDETKTYDDHFQDQGYTTPQQQIDGGYPIFIQPIDHLTPASYQEEYDCLGVLKSSIITVTPTMAKLAGDGEIEVDIEFRETNVDPWIKHTNQTRVYAQNFRYVRFTLRLVADSKHDLVEVSRVDMRLNVKIRNDAGSGTAAAADVNGTQVDFNVAFVDVASITVTPNTTTAVIPVYNFVDTQNPTSFTVYLFDKNGNRVDGDFSWAVRGY